MDLVNVKRQARASRAISRDTSLIAGSTCERGSTVVFQILTADDKIRSEYSVSFVRANSLAQKSTRLEGNHEDSPRSLPARLFHPRSLSLSLSRPPPAAAMPLLGHLTYVNLDLGQLR